MRQQGDLLRDIVSSYVGALIQREHIKNKRLDDIMTTAGNAQQAQLQRMNDRLAENLHKVLDDRPTGDYGPAPRQLGVTPYPAPPNTTEVTVPDDDDFEQDDRREQERRDREHDEKQRQPIASDGKKGISPLTAGLLGATLALTGAGGGFALNSYVNRSNVEQPTQPPSTTIIEGSGGTVDVLVR